MVTVRPPLWVTILAGGSGSRFWPLSTSARPKQLLPLAGPDPLIVDTLERIRGFVPPERLRILTAEEMVAPIRAATGLERDAFLVEPCARGTGPALARAAWEIANTEPEAIMVSLHADHFIRPPDAFRNLLKAGMAVAQKEQLLLTVAVHPDRPETGYGYIKPGDSLDAPEGHSAYRVDSFVEKPDAVTAAHYVASGYRWNSGIFIWPVATFLDEVRAHSPEIRGALHHLERGDVAAFFREAETVTVDVAVLEPSLRVGSIDATFQWDDVGSWESLSRTRAADDGGNVCEGDVFLLNAARNIVVAESGRIVLAGVQNLLVVQTDHVTLVMPRSEADKMKQYLEQLPEGLMRHEKVGTDSLD